MRVLWIILVQLLLVTSVLSTFTLPRAEAKSHGTSTLYVDPPSHLSQPIGTSLTYHVKLSSMAPFNGWDIRVATDPAVISPQSISITGNLLAAFGIPVTEFVNCVNGGMGIPYNQPGDIGCGVEDGPGQAHSAAVGGPGLANGSGLLFSIVYGVAAGSGTSNVAISQELFSNGGPNPVPVAVINGFYGSSPDFGLTAGLSPFTITQGSSATSTVVVTSFNGFAGKVDLSVAGFGPASFVKPATVTATPNETVTSMLEMSSTICSLGGLYGLRITGTSGTLSHSSDLEVFVVKSVTPLADFCIDVAFQEGLTIRAGSSNFSTVGAGSVGLDGKISLKAFVLPDVRNGPVATLSLSKLALPFGGSTLTVSTSADTPPGRYTVVVIGKIGSLTHFATDPVTVNGAALGP